MQYYFDTSALAKYYVEEPGSAWVVAVLRAGSNAENTIFTASVTLTEIVSALARRFRDGMLSQNELNVLAGLVQRHFQRRRYHLQPVTAGIIVESTRLLVRFAQPTLGLRAYDAIQLACALHINQQLLQQQQVPLTFVTADQRLLRIAQQSGLPGIDPALQASDQ